MPVHEKNPQHTECVCPVIRLHRFSGSVDFQAFHASTSVGVHTRRLTPTQKQEEEADEEQSHASAAEKTVPGKKKKTVGGGDTVETKHPHSRTPRGTASPADADAKGGSGDDTSRTLRSSKAVACD